MEESCRFVLFSGVHGLKDISIDIPLAVAAGTTVNMSCGYDLESDTLYVMKWYYKGSEFFRFVPKEMPPTSTFGELGNKVIVSIHVTRVHEHSIFICKLQTSKKGRLLSVRLLQELFTNCQLRFSALITISWQCLVASFSAGDSKNFPNDDRW